MEQLHVGDGAAAVPRPTGGHLHHLRPHRQGSYPCHVLIDRYVSVHYTVDNSFHISQGIANMQKYQPLEMKVVYHKH